jgi:23S rRNA G2069 N7-methylase RlmK/C1962 C5-methylase RlmI
MYAGERSFTGTKYGILNKDTYKVDLKMGFDECMRVLEPGGVLVFKWNEMRVSTKEIIEVFGANPLLGHKSGKASKTHWVLYMKGV